MNDEAVRKRAQSLWRVLGEEAFDNTLASLAGNKSITREMMIKVANEFFRHGKDGTVTDYGPVVRNSSTRKAAVERMQHRHDSIVRFKLKRAAMAGRSAA